jgi:hypothetical protein
MADNEKKESNIPPKAQSVSTNLGKWFADPTSLLQLIATILFGISAVSVLLGWIFESQRSFLQIPLLLVGISSIILLVTMVRSGFALAIALLVIATVVTTEDFLIKISHLLREGGKIESYLAHEQPSTFSPVQSAKRTTEALLRELPALESIEKGKIESILERSELDSIIDRIGRSRALAELYKRPEKWSSVVERYRDNERFQEDLRKLRREGLLSCPEDNFSECELTPLGGSVAERANTTGKLFDIAAFSLEK